MSHVVMAGRALSRAIDLYQESKDALVDEAIEQLLK